MTKRKSLLQMTDQEMVEFILAHPVSGGKTGGGGLVKQGSGTAATDQNQEEELTSGAQGTLSQFEGPVTSSPFYKSLLTSGTEDVSQAYNNASAKMRDRAKMAGFGYASPVGQGGQSELDAKEASAQAGLPSKTAAEVAPLALEAAKATGGMGTAYGNQGASYYKGASDLEAQKMKQDWANAMGIFGQGQQGAGGLADALMFA